MTTRDRQRRHTRRAAPDADHGRPLRVALVVEAAGGGVAVHLADLINGLVGSGIEVHLIVPYGARFDDSALGADVTERCASVVRVPMRREVGLHDLGAFLQVFATLSRIKPDIVHAHSSKAGVLARLSLGPWRKVYTPHAVYTLNPSLPPGRRWFYRQVERTLGRYFSDAVIAVSEDEAQHMQQALGIPGRRIATIYNGIREFERLTRTEARAAFGLREDSFVVGVVGRFEYQKGVDRLVDVCRVASSLPGVPVQFAAIGDGDFTAASGVEPHALPANLRVIGPVLTARRYFNAFDVLALPSRYEGFPYVYLEALSAGVPIVTTRVAGADALVRRWEIGIVVENADDPQPLARAIAMLRDDGDLRSKLAANCALAAKHFTAATMVEKTLDVYRSASGGRFR